MKSLDTNIVLRFLLQDQPEQSPGVTAMLARGGYRAFAVADAVILECVWIMQGPGYRLERTLIADLILRLSAMDQISCSRILLEKVMPLYTQHSSVSFIDIYLAVHASYNHAVPLLSYDKALAKKLPELVSNDF